MIILVCLNRLRTCIQVEKLFNAQQDILGQCFQETNNITLLTIITLDLCDKTCFDDTCNSLFGAMIMLNHIETDIMGFFWWNRFSFWSWSTILIFILGEFGL